MRRLLSLAVLSILLPGCAYHYQEAAFAQPQPSQVVRINSEIRSMAKLALDQSGGPKLARVFSAHKIQLDDKERYNLRMEAEDGSIWRASLDTMGESNPQKVTVVDIKNAASLHGIFESPSSATRSN